MRSLPEHCRETHVSFSTVSSPDCFFNFKQLSLSRGTALSAMIKNRANRIEKQIKNDIQKKFA